MNERHKITSAADFCATGKVFWSYIRQSEILGIVAAWLPRLAQVHLEDDH